MVVGWYRKTKIWRESTSCSTNPLWSTRWFQQIWQSLGRTNWATLMMSDVRYFLDPLLLKSKGAWPIVHHARVTARMAKGISQVCRTSKWQPPYGIETKKIRHQRVQTGNYREVYYSRIAILYILHLLASLIVPHSSVHNQWKMSLVGVSTVSTWTYVRTWWMLPSPWVPRMTSYLQLCNCWSVGNALMLRFVVWCHVMGCWGVVLWKGMIFPGNVVCDIQ